MQADIAKFATHEALLLYTGLFVRGTLQDRCSGNVYPKALNLRLETYPRSQQAPEIPGLAFKKLSALKSNQGFRSE
jgi:hypothetical protein